MSENTAKRIAELEEQIAKLRERVSALESDENDTQNSLLDRYDQHVIESVESVRDAHPRQMMREYNTAGIVNDKKQKKRTKRLKRLAEAGKL